jgi:energy-coupling factor transporter transmembrane protein EcfT
VFEELRNLCLGLASRAVAWEMMSRADALTTWVLVANRLFSNLFTRSERMAESLQARGFHSPEGRHLNIPLLCPSSLLANIAALFLLGVCIAAAAHFHKLA